MDEISEFSSRKVGDHRVIRVDQTDSTNRLMEAFIRSGENIADGTVICAGFQYGGKGMMHTSWKSEKNANLLCSIYKNKVPSSVSKQFDISKATALAVLDSLKTRSIHDEVCIKWPNDVLIRQKKVCGILIQNSIQRGKIASSILGIGLNLNQEAFPSLPNATSIRMSAGVVVSEEEALESLLNCLDNRFNQLMNGKENLIHEEYFHHLFGNNSWHTYQTADAQFEGKVMDVDRDGRLVLELTSGVKARFSVKEISPVLTL